MHIKCPGIVPGQFAWVDQHMRPRLLDLLPKRVQSKVRAEEQFGATRTCAQLVYMLLQEQGPGDLHDIDEVSKHLRSPAPCSDPAAALTELRRWWCSLQRLQELGVSVPDVRELYRACLSIFDTILSQHADPEVQHRWNDALMRTGGTRVQTWPSLLALQNHAMGELDFLVTGSVVRQPHCP